MNDKERKENRNFRSCASPTDKCTNFGPWKIYTNFWHGAVFCGVAAGFSETSTLKTKKRYMVSGKPYKSVVPANFLDQGQSLSFAKSPMHDFVEGLSFFADWQIKSIWSKVCLGFSLMKAKFLIFWSTILILVLCFVIGVVWLLCVYVCVPIELSFSSLK